MFCQDILLKYTFKFLLIFFQKKVWSSTKSLNSSIPINLNTRTFIENFLPVNIFETLAKAHSNGDTIPLVPIRIPMQLTDFISHCILPCLGIIWFHLKVSDNITSKTILKSWWASLKTVIVCPVFWIIFSSLCISVSIVDGSDKVFYH